MREELELLRDIRSCRLSLPPGVTIGAAGITLFGLLLLASSARAQSVGGLLRNPAFQEDWAKARVFFEDREIAAKSGSFVDDFRGEDLYQRYGGVEGYGDAPVAVHVYEVLAAAR